jgi:hypothetical protein
MMPQVQAREIFCGSNFTWYGRGVYLQHEEWVD